MRLSEILIQIFIAPADTVLPQSVGEISAAETAAEIAVAETWIASHRELIITQMNQAFQQEKPWPLPSTAAQRYGIGAAQWRAIILALQEKYQLQAGAVKVLDHHRALDPVEQRLVQELPPHHVAH